MKQKIRYDLLPVNGINEVNKVLTEKLKKYNKNEWKYGLPWSEVLSSLKKHLNDFELGEDFDKNKLLNMAHVAMNALIICDFYRSFPQGDDRVLFPNKPVIALDIDDVCLDFIGGFEKKTGKKLNPYWNGTYEMGGLLEELSKDKEFWTNLETLHKPSFEPDLYITSRSIPVEWTMENLEKNGFPCAPVYCVPWNTSKVELLKQHNVSILIDDKYQNFKEATEAGIFCYLMNSVANQHYNVGHRRVYNLNLPLK